MDIDRLIKLMRMTESDSDGEALNALRMANKMLKTEKKHWGDILSTPVKSDPPTRRNNPRFKRDGPEIAEWFSVLLQRKHSSGFGDFINSVHSQYKERGFLTDAQYFAIHRAYEKACQK